MIAPIPVTCQPSASREGWSHSGSNLHHRRNRALQRPPRKMAVSSHVVLCLRAKKQTNHTINKPHNVYNETKQHKKLLKPHGGTSSCEARPVALVLVPLTNISHMSYTCPVRTHQGPWSSVGLM